MRIIAGTARSLPLRSLEGRDTRPTTDRIKRHVPVSKKIFVLPDLKNSPDC